MRGLGVPKEGPQVLVLLGATPRPSWCGNHKCGFHLCIRRNQHRKLKEHLKEGRKEIKEGRNFKMNGANGVLKARDPSYHDFFLYVKQIQTKFCVYKYGLCS